MAMINIIFNHLYIHHEEITTIQTIQSLCTEYDQWYHYIDVRMVIGSSQSYIDSSYAFHYGWIIIID